MNARRDPERLIHAFLMEGQTELADPVYDAVRANIEKKRQRVVIGPWRVPDMSKFVPYALGVAAVVAVAVVGLNLLPGSQTGAGGPPPPASPSAPPSSLSPSPSPTPEPTASLVTHALTPFGPAGFDDPDPRAASITFTFDAPTSWEPFEKIGVWINGNGPPDGADLMFFRGGGLHSDPCLTEEEAEAEADVPVGPTVDDLVTALVDHPSLDVTSPVDVTLAGYSGKYLNLQIPDNISACDTYKPMDGHHYAQGPDQRWHMWVLDVGGVRVLVETNDFAGTPDYRLAEEQAMIDSLEIDP